MDIAIILTLAGLVVAIISAYYSRKQVQLQSGIETKTANASAVSSCNSKIPPSENHSWHPKSLILENKFKRFPRLFVHGAAGSGSKQLGLFLLKRIGFPENANETTCDFIDLEFRSYETFSNALDGFFSSLGASSHSRLPVSEKIEKIKRIAQSKDLAILMQDVEVLTDSEKRDLYSLVSNLSARAHVFITSTEPFPSDWPINVEQLTTLSVADIQNYASSIAREKSLKLEEEYTDQFIELHNVTGGHYDCIGWALKAESTSELKKRISELRNGGGVIRGIIHKFFHELPDHEKSLLWLLVNFGGAISLPTLIRSNPFHFIDVDRFRRSLRENLVAAEYPAGDNFYLKISPSAIEEISSFRYQVSSEVIENWADRLTSHYQSYDEINGSNTIHVAFDSEVELILSVATWLIEKRELTKVETFYRATCELLFNRGFFEQRVQYGTEIAEALRTNGFFKEASWIHASASSVNTLLSQYDEAERGLNIALEVAQEHSFVTEELRAKRAIAGLYYRKGIIQKADEEITAVLINEQVNNDKSNKVDALYVKSGIDIFNGLYDEARVALEEMKRISSEIHWVRGGAYADLELAIMSAIGGDLDRALELAIAAQRICETYNDRRQIARCQLAIGKIELAKRRRIPLQINSAYKQAIELIEKALGEFDSLRMDNEASEARLVLGAAKHKRIGDRVMFQAYFGTLPIGGD